MALGARFSGLIRDGGVVSRDGFPRVEEGLYRGGGGKMVVVVACVCVCLGSLKD